MSGSIEIGPLRPVLSGTTEVVGWGGAEGWLDGTNTSDPQTPVDILEQALALRLEPAGPHTPLGHQRNGEFHCALHACHHQLAQIALFTTWDLEE